MDWFLTFPVLAACFELIELLFHSLSNLQACESSVEFQVYARQHSQTLRHETLLRATCLKHSMP